MIIRDASSSTFLINKSGIYKISCLVTKKFYIGSSKNLSSRFSEHLRSLYKGKHKNILLQRAWNKYGRENFYFEVIEFVEDIDSLINIEQQYLDKTQCWKRSIGYNIRDKAIGGYISTKKKKGGNKGGYTYRKDTLEKFSIIHSKKFGKEYNLLSPWGEIIQGKGLNVLCKRYKLSYFLLNRMIRGEKSVYKGWINLDNLPPTIKLLSPHNIIYEVFEHDLPNFFKHRKIKPSELSALMKGKQIQIQGWSLVSNPVKKFYLTSPQGEKFLVIDKGLAKFAKKHNMHHASISLLKKRKIL